jgi:Flp pilus assembly protein TadD
VCAQRPTSISGELFSDNQPLSGTYFVELCKPTEHSSDLRTNVSPSGRFEFSNVPSGNYLLKVVNENGDIVSFENVSTAMGAYSVRIHVTEALRSSPGSGTVSLSSLRHKPPKKAIQEMAAAEKRSRAGDSAGAMEHLKAAVRLDPDYGEAHTNLGVAYARAGKFDTAYDEFTLALKIGPQGAIQNCNLAVAALALNRDREAEAAVRRALAVDSRNPQSNFMMGKVLSRQPEHFPEAVKYLGLALPEVPSANLLLAQVYARSGKKREAIAALETYQGNAGPENRKKVQQMIQSLR